MNLEASFEQSAGFGTQALTRRRIREVSVFFGTPLSLQAPFELIELVLDVRCSAVHLCRIDLFNAVGIVHRLERALLFKQLLQDARSLLLYIYRHRTPPAKEACQRMIK